MQYIPVVLALSQSTDPQRQLIASSFAEVPSVMLHAAYLLHVLSAATQCIPVVLALSQSTDPQRQLITSSFAEVPSVILQDAGGLEQVLDAAVQTMPVPFPSTLLVQSADPQRQPMMPKSSFAEAPSVILQTPIFRHMFSFA